MKLLLSIRLLARDWRGGELGILLVSLLLAVSVVVGISSFVNRLQGALMSESARFLAADMVVASRTEPPDAWLSRASEIGLRSSLSLGFPSMLLSNSDMALVSVKAVAEGYPLRGSLQWSRKPFGLIEPESRIPEFGEVWLAPRLFALLEINLGDEVKVGEATLKVTGTVRNEPDATTAVFGFGPRLMMNQLDIVRTGVVRPGSRVQYRLLLAGDTEDLADFEAWIEPQLGQGQSLQTVKDAQPRIGDTLDRAQGFLLLAGSLGVVLAAAAITLAARRFGERHTKYVAILKSLGAQSAEISRLYGISLLLLGILAIAIGSFFGWLIQESFVVLLATLLPFQPASAGWEPLAIGAVTALVCLCFFAWPPFRRLGEVTPLLVLRSDIGIDDAQRPTDFVFGGIAMISLMWWYSADLKVTLALTVGLCVVIGLGFFIAKSLLTGGRNIGSFAGSVWRLAMAGLQRRGNGNAMQMVVFAIAIMLMLLLSVVRSSLINQWQEQLPPGTPNHFLINLAPEERDSLSRFFSERSVRSEALYPMTRGRVMKVNSDELPVWDEVKVNSAPRQREANFTWSEQIPVGNVIVDGEWWQADTLESLVSVEESFARDIGATIGDQLTLQIGSEKLIARIASIRKVDWQSMRPNFYMVFPRRVLEAYPGVYMTTFFLEAQEKTTLNELVRRFPTVTVIEVDVVIREMRQIIDQVARAIELVLGVILVAGSLVLIAGVQSSLDSRLAESALLRAIGARKSLILGSLWIEFAGLGAMAGALASIGAEAAAWCLQTQVFELTYESTPLLWILGPLLGAFIVGSLGVWSCRRVTNTPPVAVLREV